MQIKKTTALAIAFTILGSNARPTPEPQTSDLLGGLVNTVTGLVGTLVNSLTGLAGAAGGAATTPATTPVSAPVSAPVTGGSTDDGSYGAYGYGSGSGTGTSTTTGTGTGTATSTGTGSSASSTASGSASGSDSGSGNSTTVISGNVADCPSETDQYCCNQSSDSLGLDCLVQSVMGIGSTCSAQTICCVNDGGSQSCQASNGASITVPITLGGINISL